MSLKILLVGDAVVSTGFARCTHALAGELHARGHEVAILGINYFGDPHPYPYHIFPCYQPQDGGKDAFGASRLPRFIDRMKPDAVVLLNDPWNVDGYFSHIENYRTKNKSVPHHTCPIIGWLAVDGKNQCYDGALNQLAHIIAWTDFASSEFRAGGYTGGLSVVPLGVDHTIFTPKDRILARQQVFQGIVGDERPSPTSFIVGVVGRNQYRKRIDLALQYFADWIHGSQVNDAYLYLHCAPTGEDGVDIPSLASYYGLGKRVILARPHIGYGEPTGYLPYLYSSFDIMLNTSQGEGWGLPTLEAMACGVPSIVPDWGAFDHKLGWTGGAALAVHCSSTAMTAPMNTAMFTIGGVMDRQRTVNAINALYRNADVREAYSQRCLSHCRQFSWEKTGQKTADVVERVVRTQDDTHDTHDTQPVAAMHAEGA